MIDILVTTLDIYIYIYIHIYIYTYIYNIYVLYIYRVFPTRGERGQGVPSPLTGKNLLFSSHLEKFSPVDSQPSQYVKLTQLWALTVNCRPNHYTIEISVLRLEMQFYNIFTNVLYIISLNFKDLWTTYHLWIYQVYMSQLHLASELYWKCTLGGKGLFRH